MGAYILKRLLAMIPTLLGVAVLIFILLRVVPGDVVEARYLTQGSQFQSQELMNLERKKLGLDQPLWKQFTTWMGGVVRLDFGLSMWTGAPITEEIKLRFALSLQLAIMASLIAQILAIPLGILAAVKQDTWVDYVVRVFSIAGLAVLIASATVLLDPGAIYAIRADGRYTHLQDGAREYFCNLSITELESRLDPNRFLRVHRSHIIQVRYVKAMRRKGDGAVVTMGEKVEVAIPISRSALPRLKARLLSSEHADSERQAPTMLS